MSAKRAGTLKKPLGKPVVGIGADMQAMRAYLEDIKARDVILAGLGQGGRARGAGGAGAMGGVAGHHHPPCLRLSSLFLRRGAGQHPGEGARDEHASVLPWSRGHGKQGAAAAAAVSAVSAAAAAGQY